MYMITSSAIISSYILIFNYAASKEVKSSYIQVTVQTIPSGDVIINASEDLNLTCRVNSNASPRYQVSWTLPVKRSNREYDINRVTIINKEHTELTALIRNLDESDSGQYTCEVIGKDFQKKSVVRLTVRPNNHLNTCSDNFFPCANNQCIPKRYLCDGFQDCPDGKDESWQTCGPDICKGKIICDDGRCLSEEQCCDPEENPDCRPYLIPCCLKPLLPLLPVEENHPSTANTEHNRDLIFVQSTIYTVISCVVAFILITLIMIIGFCRFHMKRSAMLFAANSQSRTNQANSNASRSNSLPQRLFYWPWRIWRSNSNYTSRWSAGDEDSFSQESLCQSQIPHPYPCSVSSTGSFIIMYSGPNGVCIERLPKPPPYSEAPPIHMTAISPEDDEGISFGPPPVYRSVENVFHPSEEEVTCQENECLQTAV